MIDLILPKKKGQAAEDRARDIEGALDWLRSKEPGADEDTRLASMQPEFVSLSRRTPQERTKNLDEILSWCRSGGNKSKDPTGEFRKIDSLLQKTPGQTPEHWNQTNQ